MAKKGKRVGPGGSTASSMAAERRHILTPNSNFFVREAYKTLRTNTMFALAEHEGCKIVLVTSSLQGEGKSITALNLAISFTEAENRVLLMDCDLRRPKLARLLRKSSRVGLSNLLLDPSLLNEVVIPSGIERLDVILSGDIPPNPSELLGSSRMSTLLTYLRKHYDYIIFDTPPINMVTDSVVLAPKSDGVLFVVRAGQSERGAVAHAVEQLEYAQAKLLGFVLDDVSGSSGGYGYNKYKYKRYGRYGYGYGYGYSSRQQPPDGAPSEDSTP
jgi:capsular exopolysaccharide synthesis family protein